MAMPWAYEDAPAWVITSYFNPVGYRRRLANYRLFRRYLEAPLLTVELAHHGSFELTPNDADRLVQLRGGDIMWQKERLLNLALAALPKACRVVAWLDCDLVFERAQWLTEAVGLLDRFALVQPFTTVDHLRPDEDPACGGSRSTGHRLHSLAFQMARGHVPRDAFVRAGGSGRYCYSAGVAWVARRETVATHGFYDASILGGGDKLLAAAAYGRFVANGRAYRMTGRRLDHYCAWADRFWRATRGSVGHLAGTLFHLWHGDIADRNYVNRFEATERFDFDPTVDIALTESGCWRWNSSKPDLHRYLREYFTSRREDGEQARG